jgi:hypothetical protein
MWHAWERKGKCTRLLWESQRERDRLKDEGIDESDPVGSE